MRWCDHESWDKIYVVRCGLDKDYFQTRSREEVSFPNKFVCVGRLCEQKGQLLLLDAFAKLLQTGVNATLVLAGDGEMRSEVERRIYDLRLQNHVSITGWLSGHQVQQTLTGARALVLPSFAEGLPVVIMEAFAMGIPAITTFIAGIPELVKDKENGWLIPAGTTDHLVEALQSSLDASPEIIAKMGHCARQTAFAQHNIESESQKLHTRFLAKVGKH